MVDVAFPGVYVEELPVRARSIEGVSTSTAAFIGGARRHVDPVLVSSFAEFERAFGSDPIGFLPLAVRGFFDNGGERCHVVLRAEADPVDAGLVALAKQHFSILCCPDEHQFSNAAAKMADFCERRKNVFCILQSPPPPIPDASHTPPVRSSYAAYYYPWLVVTGLDGRSSVRVPAGGHIAGAYARVDREHGVHHVPANVRLSGVLQLSEDISPAQTESLVARRINVLRTLPEVGIVIWGARTTSEDANWQYVNVRRLLLFIEESIARGVQWAVFEPDRAAAWVAASRTIENFLSGLWRAGALAGTRQEEAFFVRCDRATMTQADIDAGRLVVIVGVAPVRPAEFVMFRITGAPRNAAGL